MEIRDEDFAVSSGPSLRNPNFTLYTTATWACLLVVSIKFEQLEQWLDELKTWAVVANSTAFFAVLHWQLEISEVFDDRSPPRPKPTLQNPGFKPGGDDRRRIRLEASFPKSGTSSSLAPR